MFTRSLTNLYGDVVSPVVIHHVCMGPKFSLSQTSYIVASELLFVTHPVYIAPSCYIVVRSFVIFVAPCVA